MAPSTTLLTTALLALATLPFATAAPLFKRKDESYLLPKEVIILLVILGAGLAVCMGFAVHANFGFRQTANGIRSAGAEQSQYMTEVRSRNVAALMAEGHKTRMDRGMAGGMRRGESAYE